MVANGANGTELYMLAESRFQQSINVPLAFFEKEAEQVSQACLAMARRFHRNGRLMAFGAGNAVTDAQHISVEFVHPVIVGKRALPALALGTDMASTVGLAMSAGWQKVYAQQIATLGRAEDIALGIDPFGNDAAVLAGLAAARTKGALTIGLTGGDGGLFAKTPLDFCFIVRSNDVALIQETHEILYHVLWELVHVLFEHKGLLGSI
jgi:D-sedoheptulose 7-phosphate isomerase